MERERAVEGAGVLQPQDIEIAADIGHHLIAGHCRADDVGVAAGGEAGDVVCTYRCRSPGHIRAVGFAALAKGQRLTSPSASSSQINSD